MLFESGFSSRKVPVCSLGDSKESPNCQTTVFPTLGTSFPKLPSSVLSGVYGHPQSPVFSLGKAPQTEINSQAEFPLKTESQTCLYRKEFCQWN
jgi:hypothetical protein